MNVLVVEDDNISRLAISHTLQKAGYEVFIANDGREALDLLREHRIQLVVSDWGMPNLDGIQLCRTIRQSDFPYYVYFILLTSHSQLKYTLQGFEAGTDDFITKPFNPEELILRVNVGRRTIALDTRDLAIFTMGKLTETRDLETGTHLSRMRNYSRVLASWLAQEQRKGYEIDESFVNLIYKTSPLHDIGKIAIPDCVLLKPGRLDEGEFEIMKMHTLLGARMLGAAMREFPNAEFLQMAQNVALSHHERYDGGGYPQGLAGGDIPICGRIVALADVYDALTSKRVYKKAHSHDFAKMMITEKSKGQFDPVVVEAFLANERKFTAIHAEFTDEKLVDPPEYAAAIFNLPSEMDI